jgi:hypothetical protein
MLGATPPPPPRGPPPKGRSASAASGAGSVNVPMTNAASGAGHVAVPLSAASGAVPGVRRPGVIKNKIRNRISRSMATAVPKATDSERKELEGHH